MIEILADDRELNGGVIPILRERKDVSVVVERQPLGDYLIDRTLLVERKTLPRSRTDGCSGRVSGWPARHCGRR